jgi:hypothetical protein
VEEPAVAFALAFALALDPDSDFDSDSDVIPSERSESRNLLWLSCSWFCF